MLNRIGDSTPPCLTPLLTVNGADIILLQTTEKVWDLYQKNNNNTHEKTNGTITIRFPLRGNLNNTHEKTNGTITIRFPLTGES
jgi:predicted DNA repair protein MutK